LNSSTDFSSSPSLDMAANAAVTMVEARVSTQKLSKDLSKSSIQLDLVNNYVFGGGRTRVCMSRAWEVVE
jgi:hypothetical protein